jgi:hypothetical protein
MVQRFVPGIHEALLLHGFQLPSVATLPVSYWGLKANVTHIPLV